MSADNDRAPNRRLGITGRKLGSYGIELQLLERSLAGLELQAWHKIIVDIVEWAYTDRPTCLVEIDNVNSLLRQLAVTPVHRMRSRGLLLCYVPVCSPELLHEVAGDYEFQITWLWLASILAEDNTTLERLLTAVDASRWFQEVPETGEELMVMVDDSRCLWWLNPVAPLELIVPQVRRTTESVGWEFDSSLLQI